MSESQIWIQLIAVIVAVACALPGVFLVLRRMAMISDAISHSVLFGIVIGFLLLKVEIGNPILIVTAAASGVLTVWLVELLIQTRRVRADAAIGLVFPALFSIGVVIISAQFRNVHLDIDAVLLGEIAFAPLNRVELLGVRLPLGLLVMGTILILNVALIALFYKELKITTFDPGLAAALGIAPPLIQYGLMTMVSITVVGAFDHVGAVLVVALMVAPPASAFMLTERLGRMLILSAASAALSALGGYWLARALDVNIAGAMATMTGLIFLAALVFAPRRGLIARRREAQTRRRRFAVEMLIVHLTRHAGQPDEHEESSEQHLLSELRWSPSFAEAAIRRAQRQGLIERQHERLMLTGDGWDLAHQVLNR